MPYRFYANFSYWSIFILLSKNNRSLCSSCSFLGYLISTSYIFVVTVLIKVYYEFIIKRKIVFSRFEAIQRQLLWHYILVMRYNDVTLLVFCISLTHVTHYTSDAFLYHQQHIHICQQFQFNLFFFFFRNACHANPGANKIVLALAQGPVKYLVYVPNQYELVNWVLLKWKSLGGHRHDLHICQISDIFKMADFYDGARTKKLKVFQI